MHDDTKVCFLPFTRTAAHVRRERSQFDDRSACDWLISLSKKFHVNLLAVVRFSLIVSLVFFDETGWALDSRSRFSIRAIVNSRLARWMDTDTFLLFRFLLRESRQDVEERETREIPGTYLAGIC